MQKLVTQLGGAEGSVEDIAEAIVPYGRRRRRSPAAAPAATSASWSRASATSGSKLARCCTPVPGDDILGFVTRGGGVSVHRRTLHQRRPSLLEQAERLVEVEWAPSADSTFVVSIQVEALDRHGLLSDVTRVLTEERRAG